MRSPLVRLLMKLTLTVVSAAVTVGLIEAGLRAWSPGYSPLFLDIYRLDADGQVGLRPGITRAHSSAEWNVTVTINQRGLRDAERPLSATARRVLAIGDSMTFGWGVELEEAFPAVAERAAGSAGIQIVKAGIPGTGTNDQAWWLERYGAEYRPQTVVVGLYVGNDFVDVQMGGVPAQFSVADGLMVRRELEAAPRSPFREFTERLKRSSMVAQQLAQAVWAYERAFTKPEDRPNPGLTAGDQWLWEFAKVHLRQLPPETERAIAETLAQLDRIARWTAAHGARLVLVVIPHSSQVYPWQLELMKKAYSLADEDLDLDRPQRLLAEWAAASGSELVDLLPAFRERVAGRPDERLFFYPNNHMNANGHRLAGELLARTLAAMSR